VPVPKRNDKPGKTERIEKMIVNVSAARDNSLKDNYSEGMLNTDREAMNHSVSSTLNVELKSPTRQVSEVDPGRDSKIS
jgi:hypothetical protein